MSFLVQNDTGGVVGATAYDSVANIDAYFVDRGDSVWSAAATAAKQQAIIKATSYLDYRYRFVGLKRNADQATEWPRTDAFDNDERLINVIPVNLKKACAELALRALSASLAPDPTRDATGGVVTKSKVKAGSVEQETEFSFIENFARIPIVDHLLFGLVKSTASSELIRS